LKAIPTVVASVFVGSFLLSSGITPAQEWVELIHRADSLSQENHIDRALELARNALRIVQSEYSKSDTAVAAVLDVLGTCYRMGGNFQQAESHYQRALNIREGALGPDHIQLANTLHNLGILRYNQSRYPEADSLHHRALRIREQYYGPRHPEVARSLNALGVLYWAQGRYDVAEHYYQQSLVIWTETLGPNHRRVADCLNNLGNLYWQQGRYAEAEIQYRLSLNILTKTLGGDHPDVAKGLNNLAILYRKQGRYDDAEPLYRQALDIWTKALGPEHPNVADCLNNLGVLCYQAGKYSEAEPILLSALDIEEKVLGSEHPAVGDCLVNLGVLYYQQGRYAEAKPLYERALAIFEASYGENHPHVADCLVNLGVLYGEQGQYNKVEPLYRRALDIQKSIAGEDHPDVAGCLVNLGYVFCDQGRYAEAEPLFRRALEILENSLGPDHPDVADCLNCLGHLYYERGMYGDAEPLYQRALRTQEKALKSDHSSIAYTLNCLGRLYCKENRYSEAEPVYSRALDIQRKAFGPNHPHVAIFLYNQADLYRREGRLADAETSLKRALNILETIMSPGHPEVANCTVGMARLYRDTGDNDKARLYGKRAYDIRRKNFQDGFEVLSEKNALLYSKFMKDAASLYLSITCDSDTACARCTQEIADVVLSSKGAVSDGILIRNKAYSVVTDSTLVSLADSLRLARFRLAKLYVQGAMREDYATYRQELSEASAAKQRLESELARESASFNRELEYWNVNCQKVIEALPKGAVLIEYLRYECTVAADQTEPRYLAVVVTGSGDATVRLLGPAAPIDSCVAAYQDQFLSPDHLNLEEFRAIAAEIYRLIVNPVKDKVSHAATLLIAPDGDLNLVSFASLVDGDGAYLIEKVPIHYLSSGRDLLRSKREAAHGTGLLAVGDPDYDASVFVRLSRTTHRSPESTVAALFNSAFGLFRGCGKSQGGDSGMPGARREVQLIAEQWQRISAEPVETYLSAAASEENLKSQCPGKRVIHLATHAYFSAIPGNQTAEPYLSEVSIVDNPLLRSGLFFAGSNLQGADSDRPGAEDGILTAEEVAGLNLDGTELVVLSACRTGIGDVMSGEGVYGLRRAFQMAGARTVISALWRVSDSATADLMGQLYQTRENNLALLMQRIAISRIQELREQRKSDHPFYWGGFVAIGDWVMM